MTKGIKTASDDCAITWECAMDDAPEYVDFYSGKKRIARVRAIPNIYSLKKIEILVEDKKKAKIVEKFIGGE